MATYTSPEDETFFASIGRMTLSWAHLEFAVDCVVSVIHQTGGSEHIEPEMPRSFKRKLAYLRRFVKQAPIGEQAAQGYRHHLNSLYHASEKRHDIIHGVTVEMIENTGEAVFIRLIRKRDKTRVREARFSSIDILKFANELNDLSSKTYTWAKELRHLALALSQSDGEQNL